MDQIISPQTSINRSLKEREVPEGKGSGRARGLRRRGGRKGFPRTMVTEMGQEGRGGERREELGAAARGMAPDRGKEQHMQTP